MTLEKPCSQLHETVLASGGAGPLKNHKVKFLLQFFQVCLRIFARVHQCLELFAYACVGSKTTPAAIILRDASHVLRDRVFHLPAAHQLG